MFGVDQSRQKEQIYSGQEVGSSAVHDLLSLCIAIRSMVSYAKE